VAKLPNAEITYHIEITLTERQEQCVWLLFFKSSGP